MRARELFPPRSTPHREEHPIDPVANITEQRELATALVHGPTFDLDDAARLAELVLTLDEWRRSGGFDPYSTERA